MLLGHAFGCDCGVEACFDRVGEGGEHCVCRRAL
jgi:hypothetical protein